MRVNRLLAGIAVVSALGALALGEPAAGAGGLRQVDVVELARWIRDGGEDVRLFDLRDSAAYEDFHLPLAEHIDPARLDAVVLADGARMVVYGGERGETVRAARRLRRRGIAPVYYLEDAIGAWMTTIMNPTVTADAPPAVRARFARIAELSRYFGGMPRIAPPDTLSTAERLRRTRRRGCAF